MTTKRNRGFTLIELLVVIGILVFLVAVLFPLLIHSREKAGRVNCVGNMKNIGLALLMYSGGNSGFFPNETTRYSTNFEPLNIQDLLDDGKIYACPSASQSLTMARNSNYRYRGSGLKDDNDWANVTTIAYDLSGNHPRNRWMNAVFIDGHSEGARPDGKAKPNGWNVTH